MMGVLDLYGIYHWSDNEAGKEREIGELKKELQEGIKELTGGKTQIDFTS